MPYKVSKVDVWAGTIQDRAGGLADSLDGLGKAGANFEFVVARRDKPGAGVLFAAPITGAKQTAAAKAAGLAKAATLQSVRVEGPDKVGLCAKASRAVGTAGVNMRGFSAAAMGKKCIMYFAFDNAADAAKAQKALKAALK
jgi:hypothetical protein